MIPSDLPPVINRPLYIYRIIVKLFSFFLFGLGTVFMITTVFPLMRLFLHPREKFRRHARHLVSLSFRFFIFVMNSLKAVELYAGDPAIYRSLSSKIIVANHPSLLDTVMIISLFPNADTIVSAKRSHSIIRGVVSQLYIFNSLDLEELFEACKKSLDQGNCIIIFPEGTRTPRSGPLILKKGAARLSLYSHCGIIPLYIGGTDKYGLGKKEPMLSFNPGEKYIYRISMHKELSPADYSSFPVPLAARRMTAEIKNMFMNSSEGETV